MKYLKLRYKILFHENPIWSNPKEFTFRSVLGMNLRKVTCVVRSLSDCSGCIVKNTCVYSTFFETNTDKNLSTLAGRDKASHPFIIDFEDDYLYITFLGKALNYIPFINFALGKAGERGIGKNRAKFDITEISVDDKIFIPSPEFVEENAKAWPGDYIVRKKPFVLEMKTPCRIKKKGKYISRISIEDLLVSIYRRMSSLEELFGNGTAIPELNNISIQSIMNDQRWIEADYYSSRQKIKIKLGGVIGKLIVSPVNDYSVLAYLDAMEKFNVGKNISFGLGKIRIEE